MRFSCLLVVLNALNVSYLSLRIRAALSLHQYVRLKHSDKSNFVSSKTCLSVIGFIK